MSNDNLTNARGGKSGTDPQPDHGNDQNGHKDNGKKKGWDTPSERSHASSSCAKNILV